LSKAHETRDSLAVTVRSLSWFVYIQLTLEICAAATNCKETTNPPILGV